MPAAAAGTAAVDGNHILKASFKGRLEVVSFALRGHCAEELLVGNLIAIEILLLIVLVYLATRPEVLKPSPVRTRRKH
jgi:hypothetical protein